MNTPITVDYLVRIPNDEGTAFVDEVKIKVPAYVDEETGDTVLTLEAKGLINDTRLRRMGLLTPAELKALRVSLGLTQKEMADYLQAGQKSYTRWELGYGRQSRLVNSFLLLLKRGRINLTHLRCSNGMVAWNRIHQTTQCQPTLNRVTTNTMYTSWSSVQSSYAQLGKTTTVEPHVPNEAVAA